MAPPDVYLYGVHPVLEALKAHPGAIREVLLSRETDRGPLSEIDELARKAGVSRRDASRAKLSELCGADAHQGVVARVDDSGARPQVHDPFELVDRARKAGREPFLLLLDGIQDPHNLGALVRSAHALGVDGVVVPKDRAADVTPSVVKASAGATAHCPVVRVVNLARTVRGLKEAGVWVVAAALADDAEELDRVDLTGPIAVVVGAEGKGIRRLVLEHCDRRVKIPMQGSFGSLNASVAGAVVLYEIARQRRAPTA